MGSSTLLMMCIVPSLLLILYYIKTKNAERIKMIEKGINPDGDLDLATYRKQTALRNGIFFLLLSIGLLTGHYLSKNLIVESEISYISMILLFGGLAFMINFLILRSWPTK
jgi:hypothetical protein